MKLFHYEIHLVSEYKIQGVVMAKNIMGAMNKLMMVILLLSLI